jgi:hypothetical protein
VQINNTKIKSIGLLLYHGWKGQNSEGEGRGIEREKCTRGSSVLEGHTLCRIIITADGIQEDLCCDDYSAQRVTLEYT